MATMYPHQPLKTVPRRRFHVDYVDPFGGPGTLLMEGLSVGGTLKDAERRFPELTITRVYLQATTSTVGSPRSLRQAQSGAPTDIRDVLPGAKTL